MNGEDKAGITIMYMAKMDAGDILAKEELPILDSDNQVPIYKIE